MRILFLSRWFPYPSDNGAKIRIFNLIKTLSTHNQIHLVSFVSEDFTKFDKSAMFSYCQKIDTVLYKEYRPNNLKALLGFFSDQPRSLVDAKNLTISEIIKNTLEEENFDLVIASEIDMAIYAVPIMGIPKILEELELSVLYENYSKSDQPIKKFRNYLTWWKFSRFITKLLQEFDGCTVVSTKESELLKNALSIYKQVEVVPNSVDLSNYIGDFGEPVKDSLIYSGALTYAANFDAVKFFLEDVYPLLLADNPDIIFSVTGGLGGVPLEQLPKYSGVRYTGYLNDVRPAVKQSWVSVVPLRLGGGTRLKILKSLALGTPVVSTSKGAEGLELVQGKEIMIADTPEEMAAVILKLLKDPSLHKNLSINGKKAVANKYDWVKTGDQFEEFIKQCTVFVKSQNDG